jgi:hypothetical protein
MRLGSIQCRLLGVLAIGVICSVISVQASTTAMGTITVRILPRSALNYDLSSEVTLQGQVVAREKDILLVRLRFGTVRVVTGTSGVAELLQPGTAVEVVAAKLQVDGGQRFLAREIRYAGGTLVIRDANGSPVQL